LAFPTDATLEIWLLLALSGFVGFFLADLCLFKALVMIGPRLTMLVQSLTPPITAVISWLFLGDRLSAGNCLGMTLTLTGIVWVVMERPEQSKETPSPGHLRTGLLLAVLAAVGQAVGFVLYRERVSLRAAGGAVLSIVGVAMLVL